MLPWSTAKGKIHGSSDRFEGTFSSCATSAPTPGSECISSCAAGDPWAGNRAGGRVLPGSIRVKQYSSPTCIHRACKRITRTWKSTTGKSGTKAGLIAWQLHGSPKGFDNRPRFPWPPRGRVIYDALSCGGRPGCGSVAGCAGLLGSTYLRSRGRSAANVARSGCSAGVKEPRSSSLTAATSPPPA